MNWFKEESLFSVTKKFNIVGCMYMTDNKSVEIYGELKNKIIDLEYKPGLILNESVLAEDFNVSRATIRSALRLLQTDKLLNIIPRFGVQVAPIDFKEMKFVFEITRVLDPFAARLAAERISEDGLNELDKIVENIYKYEEISKNYKDAITDDERFHNIIASNCGNPWLQEILTGLHYHTKRLWNYSESYFDSFDLFTDTLGKVLKAMKEKDLVNVEKFSREHIDDFVFKIKKEML